MKATTKADVIMWAKGVMAAKAAKGNANKLLGVKDNASFEQAQEAFHAVARSAHPDLHRHHMTPEELEMITSAYAAVAGAYQDVKEQIQNPRTTVGGPAGNALVNAANEAAAAAAAAAAAEAKRVAAQPRPPGATPAQSMNARALVHYRKAELALRRGDIRGALLLVKMAIAADPQSGLLRSALAEVELEVRKGT